MNKTESKYFLSLDGTWKFNWVANADQRPTDFYKEDLDDSKWKTMKLPGNWEMNGFGDPGVCKRRLRLAWPFRPAATSRSYQGQPRRFLSPYKSTSQPTGMASRLVAHFGSVTSNIYLYVNGKFAGYAEDSKVAAEFDITPYLKRARISSPSRPSAGVMVPGMRIRTSGA